MSGTSADGVDAAVVEWPKGEAIQPFNLLAFKEFPFPGALQERIHALAAARIDGAEALRELGVLDRVLAEHFAEAAGKVASAAGLRLEQIDVVASHGQTVAHHPDLGATLQIGSPSLIAERTGCLTVGNFRPRDIAAGGEGAPLAPFFHWGTLADPDENRAALNLGGIANLTWLPRGGRPEDVIAFDVGPANSLIDGAVQLLSEGRERFDRNGERAKRGRSDEALLASLLDDDYLNRPPPKSTGRERYGLAEAEALVERWRREGREEDDLIATLTAFTAEAVARACRDHLPGGESLERLLVGGGGARNPALMHALQERMPGVVVADFDSVGVDAGAAEAMAFSLMGRNAVLGIPNHLPRCTGARHATVLGEIAQGRQGRRLVLSE